MSAGVRIAVDWGTSRLRAWLVGADGAVAGRVEAPAGVQSVAPGGHAATLAAACGAWLSEHPAAPVAMAGMVGSRNSWVEAPYARAPCGLEEIAARCAAVPPSAELGDRAIFVVPGVDARGSDGAYDVMRGEETQALGAGVDDGLVCLPGTHGKWVAMERGRIAGFATFVTGEAYAALTGSFLGRLARSPDDAPAGEAAAQRAGRLRGGLLRAAFQARAGALGGDFESTAVRPMLSRLLVDSEIAGARDLFGAPRRVTLVAGAPLREVYARALAAAGVAVETRDPDAAFLAGIARVAAAREASRTPAGAGA
ncbi:MAG: 2-dehydro-3-deoxygalactonokinase [Hyphomicrobiales bacterium]|nr:2-dehydro-3-deoxygalactonokinase [Hyphomicrobiales bacterium]